MRETVLSRYADILLAGLVVSVVAMMIVPLPTALLDLLLTLNIALSVVLLMVSIYVSDAMRIAAFPTILLITTLFRLGLNVSTTRLILAQADAGDVIRSFGDFVVAGNLVVGAIVFLIITLIQFVVIARGSERVAEVAARFTLDAMPGKQMAIDADLRAGLIDAAGARRRRAALERESQFYGSMDGAMKFVKGDAIAAILITVINVVGGLIIGIGYRGMSAGDAASVYSLLSIGDGLVAQIPALIISLAAGLIVTRVASEDEGAHLGQDIVGQVLAEPRAVGVAAALLIGLGAIPGLPTVPFLVLGAACAALAASISRRRRAADEGGVALGRGRSRREDVASISAADADIELGGDAAIALDLAPDVVYALSGGDALAEALDAVRQRLYDQLGVIAPPIEIREASLSAGGHRLSLSGVVVDDALTSPLRADRDDRDDRDDRGERDGDGNRAAAWREAICARVEAVLARYAFELIGLQETQTLLDRLADTHEAAVREVIPAVAAVPRVTEVLRRLVAERVSIRELAAVLRAIAIWAPRESDPDRLAEYVRSELRAQITAQYAPGGVLRAWSLAALIEDTVRDAVQTDDSGSYLALEPDIARDIVAAVGSAIGAAAPETSATVAERPAAVVLTELDVRRHLRELLCVEHPAVVVLAPSELRPEVRIERVGEIGVV